MKMQRSLNRISVARMLLLSGCLSFLAIVVMAGSMEQARAAGTQDAKSAKPAMKSSDSDQDAEAGQKKFQANCSRCHDAPEQFSPRIAGTIVRHMRVRASLSAQDEKDILKFLAP